MPATTTPEFPRCLRVVLHETDLALARLVTGGTRSRVMFDVGSHHGTSTTPFAEQGWRVYAFEPDPTNRAEFLRNLSSFHNVTVDPRAVSDEDGKEITLYDSEESTGITSLIAFTGGHRSLKTVRTVRLDTFMVEAGIGAVDFLKVDTEGFDLMVLRGFPWDEVHPSVVLCEYEDNKTTKLDYTSADMIQFLLDLDYTLLVSEWHPIERYGIPHSFRQLRRYEDTAPPASSWENLLAVENDEEAYRMLELAPISLARRNNFDEAPAQSMRFDAWQRFSRRSEER